MTNMTWQDPPASAFGRVPGGPKYSAEAAELRANPKRWALLMTRDNARSAAVWAAQARRGDKAAFRPVEEWEFNCAGCDVYARYVGPDGAA
jgi:hypothetical protein